MKEKRAVLVAALLIVLSIPMLTTMLATESVAFSERFYLKQYEILNLKQATGFSSQEYKRFSQALWEYYRNQISSPQVLIPSPNGPQPLYQEHEIAHLADVRHLFRVGWIGRNLALLLLAAGTGLIWTVRKSRAGLTVIAAVAGGSGAGIACFLILLLAVRLDFNRAFTFFHIISFDNMLWQLDPATDNLIKLFPEQFFLNATVAIATRVLGALSVLLAASCLLLKKYRPGRG